jgi:hypothetical protein
MIMKNIKTLAGCLLILAGTVFITQKVSAQNKKEPTSKYSIRVTKKSDGKVITIDTTFETKGDFDVDTWIKKHDTNQGEEKNITQDIRIKMRPFRDSVMQKRKEFRMFTPDDFLKGNKFLSDTLIMHGDTIIMKGLHNHLPGEFGWNNKTPFHDFGEFGYKEWPFHDSIYNFHVNPPKVPHYYWYNNIPGGIEQYLPKKQPDKVIIVKKRHGKKIIITTKEPDKGKLKDSSKNKDEAYILRDDDTTNPKVKHMIYIRKTQGNETEIKTGIENKDNSQNGKKVLYQNEL